jgi:cell division protease FtsH
MNVRLRNVALWAIIAILLLALLTLFQNPRPPTSAPDISFSRFLDDIEQGRVRNVLIMGPDIQGTFTDGRSFQSYAPSDSSWLQRLYSKGVEITVRRPEDNVPWFISLLVAWLPFLALIAVWVSLSRQQMRMAQRPYEEIDGLKRQMEEMQKRLDKLSDKDKG